MRVVPVPHAPGCKLGDRRQLRRGNAEVAEMLEAAEAGELLDPGGRIVLGADRRAEPRHRLGDERGVVAERGGQA